MRDRSSYRQFYLTLPHLDSSYTVGIFKAEPALFRGVLAHRALYILQCALTVHKSHPVIPETKRIAYLIKPEIIINKYNPSNRWDVRIHKFDPEPHNIGYPHLGCPIHCCT